MATGRTIVNFLRSALFMIWALLVSVVAAPLIIMGSLLGRRACYAMAWLFRRGIMFGSRWILCIHPEVRGQENMPADAPPYERIRAAVDAHLTTLLKHGDYTSANISIFTQIPEEIRQRQIPKRDAFSALWRRILSRAQKAGALRDDVDLSMVRMLLLGALNWSVEWYKPGKTSIHAMADHVCLMLLEGIGADDVMRGTAADKEEVA